ncbi:MAG: DNA methyltransferase [Acidobacteriota bacterium]
MSEKNLKPLGRSEVGSVAARIFATMAEAARDRGPVSGWTHNFYRYPARFSPTFAAAAIECFSKPGGVIADPYMGGGTTIVEGMVAGRNVLGNDLNSLAAFVTKVKITPLGDDEVSAINAWAAQEIPGFKYRVPADDVRPFIDQTKIRNLSLVRGRFIKKAVGAALTSIANLPTTNAQDFARCAVLRAAQWALDGRSRHTPLGDFRAKLARVILEMVEAIALFAVKTAHSGGSARLFNVDAGVLHQTPFFPESGVDLVVTSPPYPGVHVLYHRWQVDGRRETPAPYWIAGCNDGQGASFYNFGDRRQGAADKYFRKSVETLRAVRAVMRNGGYMVQMVAFNKPEEQLTRYLENMESAGFVEARFRQSRIWRQVPQRKWHATYRGQTEAANEVVLIHRAA